MTSSVSTARIKVIIVNSIYPFEYYNPKEFFHLPIVFQRKSNVVDQGECLKEKEQIIVLVNEYNSVVVRCPLVCNSFKSVPIP